MKYQIGAFLISMNLLTQVSGQVLPVNIKDCSGPKYQNCFESRSNDFRNASKPFVMFHQLKSSKSALLLHGLSDSPFYMKDIGKLLFDQGYDVYAVLLEGHGTIDTDLQSVRLEDWQNQVSEAIESLRSHSERVLLAGFSTGAVLAIDYLSNHQQMPISGLMLFSPAIEIASKFAPFSCQLKGIMKWAKSQSNTNPNPTRYNLMATNGVCQLYRLTKKIQKSDGFVSIPVFSVQSEFDKTVAVDSALEFLSNLRNPLNRNIIIESPLMINSDNVRNAIRVPSQTEVMHSDVPLRYNQYSGRSNPIFPFIEYQMRGFLSDIENASKNQMGGTHLALDRKSVV